MKSVDSDSPNSLASSPHFPLSAPVFMGKSRAIGLASVLDWFEQGWGGFVDSLRFWLLLTAAILGFAFVMIWSWVGPFVFMFLMPFFSVGFLSACEALSNGNEPKFTHFLLGFTVCPRPLLILGLFNVVFFSIIVVLVAPLWLNLLMRAYDAESFSQITVVFFGLGLATPVLIFVLCSPVLMAIWFAPALIFFNRATPGEAIKASFNACRKNILPFFMYGFLMLTLLFFAVLPVGLGLFLAIPLLAGSAYASYHDIFLAN